MRLRLYVMRLLGWRPLAASLVVTLLVVALIASASVASRYALKEYAEEQLARSTWDITGYQNGDLDMLDDVSRAMGSPESIVRNEELLFLRAAPGGEDVAFVDGAAIDTPTLSLFTVSDLDLLPANIRPRGEDSAVLILLGTKSQVGDAYASLQKASSFELREPASFEADEHEHGGHDHGHQSASAPVDDEESRSLFTLPIERVIRLERNQLNRWFLDETSSPAMLPEIGVVLVARLDERLWIPFDRLGAGIVHEHEGHDIHELSGDYFVDAIHLLSLDRDALVSGWDIPASLEDVRRVGVELEESTRALGPRVFVDNTTGVLLERMGGTARVVGLVSLLVSLPLVWMGWVLMGHLSRLLLLNERRKFGLLRLRGVSGRQIGRALQLSLAAGALGGGLLGGVLGTVVPLLAFEGSLPPLGVVVDVQEPYLLGVFIAIGVAVALLVSRGLVRYVSSISPLEATGRVATSEIERAGVRFGWWEGFCLVLGGLKAVSWVVGVSLADLRDAGWVVAVERGLDLVAFPLFVYGFVALLVSRRRWLGAALGAIVTFMGGRLKRPIMMHISTKPHRAAGFLLIVILMTIIGLYPTVMTAVFDNKVERGTAVQLGSDVHLAMSPGELIDSGLLASGGIGAQFESIQDSMAGLLERVQDVEGVESSTYLIGGVAEGVYVPGHGYSGLPLYFIPSAEDYLATVSYEESLGAGAGFSELLGRLPQGEVLLSPAVADHTHMVPGDDVAVGLDADRQVVDATVGGTVGYLPASPLTSITDKASFADARVEYLNHLFDNNAYLVADPGNERIQDLDVLITGVHLAIGTTPGADNAVVAQQVSNLLPAEPLAIRTFEEELQKVGTDMYIFLARENVKIYLVGGLLLALVGMISIAYTNFLEDRRTLGLLRIRGVGLKGVSQFFSAGLFAPSIIGIILGVAISLVVGFGMADLVFDLRAIRNILVYIPTRLAVSIVTILIAAAIITILGLVGGLFSKWIFRRTARQGLTH